MRDRLDGICEQVLDRVGDRAEAEVWVAQTRSELTRFANSFIHQHVGEETIDVRVRLVVDGKVAAGSTTRSSGDHLDDLVERVIAAAETHPVDPDWPGLAPASAVADGAVEPPAPDPAARAEQVAEFVAADEELRAAGYCDTEATWVAFANSAGQRASGSLGRSTIDGIHQTSSSAGSGHQTAVGVTELDGAAVGGRAARLARQGVDATDLEPGRYEVVLRPECVATIAVFLASYGFNAKRHLEGQSFAQLGEQQFDPAISIWDDATDERAIGLPFDTEGTPKQRLDLVREGETANLAHNRRTAAQVGAASTGHAHIGDESWGPVPLNLFVGRGDGEQERMIADVERGVLVTTFNYCRILDPKTQVVTGLTRNGTFLVEDGEVTRPLTNLRFTQSFVDALSPGQVLDVGARLRFADSEFGPGIVVAPTLRLAEWNFTGGAKG